MNFWIRLGSSITLIIVTLATIIYGGWVLAIVLLLTSLIAYKELSRANELSVHNFMHNNRINGLEAIGYIAIIIYYAVIFLSGENAMLFLSVNAILIAFMIFYVFTFPRYHAGQIMESFFYFIYAPVMLSCIFLTRNLENGVHIVFLIFISSWICDSCAYAVGMLFGKHKLVPKLSPKKSIEGSIGGILGAAIVGALYGHFLLREIFADVNIVLIFAVICALGAIISQIGDLAASAIKRNYDLKDFGKLIPGHGGIMDRFDSVIFTAPVVYVLASLLIYY
ncbi:MAG: phosphatidate cytidylyltransferase [Lachnospiraceae bacterium]|nr:phosphatidate cytidylyltransferase [Lachnospiraceae bacterium]